MYHTWASALIFQRVKLMLKFQVEETLEKLFWADRYLLPLNNTNCQREQCHFYTKSTSNISNMDHKNSLHLSTHPK